jgi:hypothetical protein
MRDRSSAPRRGESAADRAVPSRLAALAALAALALAGPRAEAYVRYKTSSGVPFFWAQTCIPVSAYPTSMTDANGTMEMTPDQIMHAATSAAAAWGNAQMSPTDPVCTFIKINVTSFDGTAPNVALDYVNTLAFVPDHWCMPDSNGNCTYAAEALAITSVFVNKTSGRILDGDIEVNAANFVWTDVETDPNGASKQDLQNALTHEMGHLIGLDHTCYVPATDANGNPLPRPTDNLGNPVPDCDSAPLAVQETVMFASAIPGDTSKRTLKPDDINAVCSIYPVASDPMICPTKDVAPAQSGCALAPGVGGRGAALVVLAALLLAARRRRGSSA